MSSDLHVRSLGNVNSAIIQENLRAKADAPPTVNFRDMLHEKLNPVNFSKHASNRLIDRNINLTGEQMERLEEGIGKASQKGIRDSLVLMDNLALVVNVSSRTVITAISEPRDNVFSNIDGAVIV
jgi:flagellar operon protein